ncbi:MAG: amino acid permease [Gammaproteobacteria bacterium]|nr:amino acid permease [Gammaproteobacteria bacterium]MCH9744556.1 amino acid permease [Gammaproteobacteria bacterium]
MNQKKPTKTALGVFPLVTLSVAAILSVRNLPIVAVYGYTAITFYILAALLFLLPTALVCAELVTTWPEAGGLYAWVKKALGPRFGFIAIWLEWTNTLVSFPMMIGFIVFTLIYPFAHALANNRWFEFIFMLAIFWGISFVNLFGIRISSWFSSFGVICGTLLVITIIIVLGAYWWLSGHPLQQHLTWQSLVPSFHFSTLAFLIVIINGFSGIQIMAFHVQDTRCPQLTYKKAIVNASWIILCMSILGTLALVFVMPVHSANLIGGIVQSLSIFLGAFHMQWAVPVIAALIALGVLSEINSWMIGPSKGLLASAEYGDLPKFFAFKNKKNVPVGILCVQAVVGSLLGAAYIFMPSVNSGYWLLSDLTAQFTIMMWILLFISAIVLAYTHQDVKRSYKIPGGRLGMWIAAGAGMVVCAVILVVSYIPPSSVIESNSVLRYECFLIGGFVFFILAPLLLKKFVK